MTHSEIPRYYVQAVIRYLTSERNDIDICLGVLTKTLADIDGMDQEDNGGKGAVSSQLCTNAMPSNEHAAIMGAVFGGTSAIRSSCLIDDVYRILEDSGDRGCSAVEIRDRLVELGHRPEQHRNFLATIHSALKRLTESKKVSRAGRGRRAIFTLCSGVPRRTAAEEKVVGEPRTDITAGVLSIRSAAISGMGGA
jgi:hypothetical protein